MIIAVAVACVAALLALLIRAVFRENRRQNAILERFNRERPVREPGLRTRGSERAAGN